jgi:hypothetical protein
MLQNRPPEVIEAKMSFKTNDVTHHSRKWPFPTRFLIPLNLRELPDSYRGAQVQHSHAFEAGMLLKRKRRTWDYLDVFENK